MERQKHGDAGSIDQILQNVVQKTLAPAKITEVYAERDVDHDGDPVVRITVVYDETRSEPRAEDILRLPEAVYPRLEAAGWAGYPVFTFMTRAEAAEEAA